MVILYLICVSSNQIVGLVLDDSKLNQSSSIIIVASTPVWT
jgi:hypothetical protein